MVEATCKIHTTGSKQLRFVACEHSRRWGYKVYLPAFEGRDPQKTVINDPSDFTGCGGNSVWDLNTIEFRHDGFGGSDDKFVCLDHIVLS